MTVPDALAVSLRDVTVRRGDHLALDGVTAEVPRGSITGLLGPSGCGKTTLMRSIVGAQAGVDGEVTVLGLPAGSPQLRAEVGYVTQAASVYPDLTVEQNVTYFARLTGRERLESDVAEALDAVDLTALAGRRTTALSGGQRSRVSIACALVGHPALLILDEPTVGLDPVLRADLWARFQRLADAGTTLLVSSHVMDEADHCDRLLLLRDGHLLADTTAAGLREETGQSGLEEAFLALITEGERA